MIVHQIASFRYQRFVLAARRIATYSIAIVLALLCSYWIVMGPGR